jgi:hypothetical protein
MIAPHEIDTVITNLERALENARAAKRIQTGIRDGDPSTRLRQARSSALTAVRVIAEHFPPGMKPAGV